MRRILIAICFSIAVILSGMGMEGFGGSMDEFPEPELNYGATVTDLEGVVHRANMVSAAGKTTIMGYRGKASLTIDFKRLKMITFSPTDSSTYVLATITFKEGNTVELKVKGLMRCYGKTDLGNISVRMRDIQKIVFDDKEPEPVK